MHLTYCRTFTRCRNLSEGTPTHCHTFRRIGIQYGVRDVGKYFRVYHTVPESNTGCGMSESISGCTNILSYIYTVSESNIGCGMSESISECTNVLSYTYKVSESNMGCGMSGCISGCTNILSYIYTVSESNTCLLYTSPSPRDDY